MTSAPPRPSAGPWLIAPRPHALRDGATWRWVLPGVGAALAWLDGHGVRAGSRLGLGAANSPACLALLQAAGIGGITLVLLSRRAGLEELDRQIAEAAVDRLAADAAHPLAGRAAAVLPEAFPDLPPPDRGRSAAAGEAALVLFTSGTSGRPRAARLGVGALTAAASAAATRLGLGPATTWLGCLSIDHIGGASVAYRAMVSGCHVLLQSQFHARETAALLGEVDGASLVPTMLHRLVAERADLPWPRRLKSLLIGGGPLSDELAARSAALGVEPLQTYGLTESGSQACTPTAPARAERGRCGTPLASLELEVRRADGARAGAGEEGQIHLRGPQLFAGYEERGALAAPLAPGAWFATGDLGDVDAAGRLRVHCRRDDLILSGGENIYPAMVEAALESHPDVAEAGVCPLPDPAWGQVVAAVVVPKHGAAVGAEALAAWVAQRLSPIQQPRRWAFRAALPRTESGKLSRRQLPLCFSDSDAAMDSRPLR